MPTWLPVPDWHGLYEVSDHGEVRSIARPGTNGRTLRPSANPKGYLIAILSGNGKRWAAPVHRLVAEAFIGPLPDGWHTCHIDGNNQNNSASNLRYATPRENELDKIRHGRNVNSNKTHCPQGHPYIAGNLVASKRGQRKCLTCHRARRRKARQDAALKETA